ncbi:MAG: hypothetical protein K2X77_12500 [Candidatus Obscuribacterales bacterium]|jgi:hypothetical protein|nr:hypothetical protein [Candidatus Obscuribacterales bacterium]
MLPDRSSFTAAEWRVIEKYRTPRQVQKFLRELSYNREEEGDSQYSFRQVLQRRKAHCLEAALVAAVILEQHGYPPLLLSFESVDELDHVIFVFQENGLWGSVARSRDAGLHGRKPVFRTARDLAWSYYDPYVDMTGRITGYAVVDLNEMGNYDWRFSKRNLWKLEKFLIDYPHRKMVSSDKRYQKLLSRYKEFRERYPKKQATYYDDKHLWM